MPMKTNEDKVLSLRANHKWTGSVSNKLFGGTHLTFKCGTSFHNIQLKGIHVDKKDMLIRMNTARLMREKDDFFFFIVDMKTHGVNWLTRKRGGHTLYTFERGSNGSDVWNIKRHFYSESKTKRLNIKGIQFHNVFWRIVRGCYYDMAIKENVGDDNSG